MLYGLAVLRQPSLPELTVPPGVTGDVAAAHLYRASLRTIDVHLDPSTPRTSVARTIADICRTQGAAAGLVTLDDALRNRVVDLAALDDVIDMCRGWPGIRSADRARLIADASAESPLESLSRFAIAESALPRPATQVEIREAYGAFVARVDFYWDEFGVVGEADGRIKYESRDVLFAEKQRQEVLENLGLVVVRWGWDDVRNGTLPARIARALRRGERLKRLALPRQWSV